MSSVIASYHHALGMHMNDRARELREAYKAAFGDNLDEIESEVARLELGHETRKRKIKWYLEYGVGIAVASVAFLGFGGFITGVALEHMFFSQFNLMGGGVICACVGGVVAVFGIFKPIMRRLNKLRDDVRLFEVSAEELAKASRLICKVAEFLDNRSGGLKKAVESALNDIAFEIVKTEKALPEEESANYHSPDLAVLRRMFREQAAFFEELRLVSGKLELHIKHAEKRWAHEAALGNVATTYII